MILTFARIGGGRGSLQESMGNHKRSPKPYKKDPPLTPIQSTKNNRERERGNLLLSQGELGFLTNDNLSVGIIEFVLWDLQVQRSRAFSDSTGNIVVRAVARTEPAMVVTRYSIIVSISSVLGGVYFQKRIGQE